MIMCGSPAACTMSFQAGEVHLIAGCMFAGKTHALIKGIKTYMDTFNDVPIVVKHASDRRYVQTANLCTHSGYTISCVCLDRLSDVFELDGFGTSRALFIDEGQFFPDLHEVAVCCAEKHNMFVCIASLDTDYKCRVFPEVAKVFGSASMVTKLRAKCVVCAAPARYSKKKDMSRKENVGGSDLYEAVCWSHMWAASTGTV